MTHKKTYLNTIHQILLFAFLLASFSVLGQENKGNVEGFVKDETDKAMEFANVLLLKANDSSFVKGAITNNLGKYEFFGIKNGSYLISVSVVGYENIYSKPFRISPQNLIVKVETLRFSSGTQLDEVKIVVTKPLFERSADRTTINVENSVVNAGSDAWEILQRAPGLTVDNNDQISILGKSGTIVLIDGKRTFLSGEALATLLRSTPSTNIAKIEVITNPSAKYDASGTAGVINIISKKNIVTGFNSQVSVNSGAGWNEFYNPGVNFNYREEKFSLYGNYNYTDRNRSLNFTLIRRILNTNQNVIFDQEQTTLIGSDEHLFGLGFDYYIAPKHTIGFNLRGFERTDGDDGLSQSDLIDALNPNQDLSVVTDSNGDLSNYAFSFNYDGKLGSNTSLYLEFNTINYEINDNELYDVLLNEVGTSTVIQDDNLRNIELADIDIKSYQFDLSHSFNKNFSADAGMKYSDVFTSNELQFEELVNNVWQNDPNFSSEFTYDEEVTAGYLNFSGKSGKFKMSGGIRVEHTESDAVSITTGENTKRSYTDYFPSFSINYSLAEKRDLGMSYSRRINRPSYQNLNPFVFFIDPFTFAIGNPLLQPQYTDNYEVSYRMSKVTISVGYSNTKDVMRFVTIQDDPTLTGTATTVNLDNLFNYNTTISYQNQLFSWWRTFTSGSLFYNRNKGNLDGFELDNSQTSFRVNTSNTFSLPKGLKIELSGFYSSPSASGINRNEAFYVFNLGVQKRLFQKLNARLTFNDVLDSSRARGGTDLGNQNLDFTFRRFNSRFVLALTYPIGNNKIKTKRKKKSGASSEDRRVIKN